MIFFFTLKTRVFTLIRRDRCCRARVLWNVSGITMIKLTFNTRLHNAKLIAMTRMYRKTRARIWCNINATIRTAANVYSGIAKQYSSRQTNTRELLTSHCTRKFLFFFFFYIPFYSYNTRLIIIIITIHCNYDFIFFVGRPCTSHTRVVIAFASVHRGVIVRGRRAHRHNELSATIADVSETPGTYFYHVSRWRRSRLLSLPSRARFIRQIFFSSVLHSLTTASPHLTLQNRPEVNLLPPGDADVCIIDWIQSRKFDFRVETFRYRGKSDIKPSMRSLRSVGLGRSSIAKRCRIELYNTWTSASDYSVSY